MSINLSKLKTVSNYLRMVNEEKSVLPRKKIYQQIAKNEIPHMKIDGVTFIKSDEV